LNLGCIGGTAKAIGVILAAGAIVFAIWPMLFPSDVTIYEAAIGDDGKAWSVTWETYRARPATQEVVVMPENGVSLQRLTKCAVWDGDDWICEDGSGSSRVMRGGVLTIFTQDANPHPLLSKEYQVSRRSWWKFMAGQRVTAADGQRIYYMPRAPGQEH
jgi:hypothetical protein